MKKITYSIFLFSLILCFSFCKSQKYTPTDYPSGQIIFGSGGGFANAINEFALLENGQLFSKTSREGDYLHTKKLNKNMVQQMFENIDFLNLKKVDLNSPGNLYYYIEVKEKDDSHKIVWGGQEAAPQKVKDFYKILNHFAKEEMVKE